MVGVRLCRYDSMIQGFKSGLADLCMDGEIQIFVKPPRFSAPGSLKQLLKQFLYA